MGVLILLRGNSSDPLLSAWEWEKEAKRPVRRSMWYQEVAHWSLHLLCEASQTLLFRWPSWKWSLWEDLLLAYLSGLPCFLLSLQSMQEAASWWISTVEFSSSLARTETVLLWLQLPVPDQSFRLPEHFFQSNQVPWQVSLIFSWTQVPDCVSYF